MPTAFAGEEFLQVAIPRYEEECARLTIYIVVAIVFWLFVFPILTSTTTVPPENNKNNDKAVKSKSSKSKTNVTKDKPVESQPPQREVSALANLIGVLGAVASTLALILLKSPYNSFAHRRVFTFPLLTADECAMIRQMAETAAALNFEKASQWASHEQLTEESILQQLSTGKYKDMVEAASEEETYMTMFQEPRGWHKLRHGNYPTTDLNWVTDPFTKDQREWFSDLLNRRFSPILERIYGVPQSAIRGLDLFVVRYDEGIRTHLQRHTDDGHLSFVILLNDEFEGGGTRYFKGNDLGTGLPLDESTVFAHVAPKHVGTAATHHALIPHEGYTVQSGSRWILAGFTHVDRIDPWTGDLTGLPLWASWLDLAWLHVKFKNGYHIAREHAEEGKQGTNMYDTQFARLLFRDVTNIMQDLGDSLSPHELESLVAPENYTAFLEALDHAKPASKQSNWFGGQMVNLNFAGRVDSVWGPRARSEL